MTNLLELIEYHRWATKRTWVAVSFVTPSDYTRNLNSSFPSLRDTLVHLFSADRAWLTRIEGDSLSAAKPETYPTLDVLRAPWHQVIERWPVLGGFTDAGTVIRYRTYAGDPYTNSLEEIVRHVVNHGSYHRGQVTTMLRQLGLNAVSTDMIYFFRERRLGQA
jgi:uncharacterized damage-inducible protein DinB